MPTPAALDINRIQYLAICGTIVFLLFIFELIRNKKIKEAYAILWLVCGLAFLFLSIFRSSLDRLAFSCGIAYPPALLFLVAICSLLLILIQFSMIISSHNDKIQALSQEIALLKMKSENAEKDDKAPGASGL